MPRPMPDDQIRSALADLTDWTFADDALHREFRFGGFPEALAFLVRVGLEAQTMNHHPELRNVYDRVWVDLSSHDAGGVTDRDVSLARRIDGIVDRDTAR